jgi:hypothetical protein
METKDASNVDATTNATTNAIIDATTNIDATSNVDATTTIIDNNDTVIPDISVAPDATTTNFDMPLMGSSQTSGAVFHGHAQGNVPNHADFGNTPFDLDLPAVKGEVSLYLTDKYPRDVNFETLRRESELVVMVKAVGGMAAVLGMVAQKCSIIQSESAFYVLRFNFPFKPEPRSRL